MALLAALPFSTLQAQVPSPEYQVKAVFLYNFTQFVTWPDDAFNSETDPLIIGVVGKDPFGDYLDETVRNETVGQHPLVVKRFNTLAEVTPCHLLYINLPERGMQQVLNTLNTKNTITVGDTENFANSGGAIQFYMEENKIRIRVNLATVKKNNLVISSKLLRLADIVENEIN